MRVKQGLMSLLAADLHHGRHAYRRSLRMFKLVYYFVSLLNWRRTYDGWKRHRFNIRDMGPLRGETVMKAELSVSRTATSAPPDARGLTAQYSRKRCRPPHLPAAPPRSRPPARPR